MLMDELEAGTSFREVAAYAPISARCLRIWWDRYQAEGAPELQDRSNRQTHSPGQADMIKRHARVMQCA